MVRVEGVPKYLKRRWKEEKRNRVARYRLGNEMRRGRYWEREEDRKCRSCGGEIETWEHILERGREEPERDEGIQEKVGRILAEDGRGEGWMNDLDENRRREMGG
ncbi:hypothetical protein X777_11286 [Ooceraea biroi]|uniref:Uncharacterized protein n=1 Tax=Ooceraea biroi TaxID=2015173 RepID=A0A026W2I6_OOCBI|nr:hypothetical protein X777_11286 [Ooceraea biroi]